MFDFNKYREIQGIIDNLGNKTKIIAVSKNHSLEAIQQAISHKIVLFGENRVQEAKLKFEGILDKNKEITLGELYTYLSEKVKDKSTKIGRQQNPQLSGDKDKILVSYK